MTKKSTPTQRFSFPVGRTGLHVPVLGLGGAALSGLYSLTPEEQAQATIQVALENGINFFDTAPIYGLGTSEQRLGKGLAEVPRSQYILASKIGKIITPAGKVIIDYSREGVLRSLEASLDRLHLDFVDILHIHDADSDEHFQTALDEAFPTLADLRAQGVIRAIGAGMNQWERLSQFLSHADFDCFLLAGRYTLLEHASLDFLDSCWQKDVRVFLGGVYNTGILATGAVPGAKYKYQDAPEEIMARVRQIEQVCRSHNVPLKAAALQFPLGHPAVTIIVGMCSPEEIVENNAALRCPIPAALWNDLRTAKLLPDTVPVPH